MIYASLFRPPAKSWQGTEKREGEHTHSTLCDTLVLQKNLEKTLYRFMSKTNQNDNTDDGGSLFFKRVFFGEMPLHWRTFTVFIIQWWKKGYSCKGLFVFIFSVMICRNQLSKQNGLHFSKSTRPLLFLNKYEINKVSRADCQSKSKSMIIVIKKYDCNLNFKKNHSKEACHPEGSTQTEFIQVIVWWWLCKQLMWILTSLW